jgi:hypothetical protein
VDAAGPYVAGPIYPGVVTLNGTETDCLNAPCTFQACRRLRLRGFAPAPARKHPIVTSTCPDIGSMLPL